MWIVDDVEVRTRNIESAKERNRETRRSASALRRTPALRVLVVSLHPEHDDSTLWWFDQGLLSVLSAAGADVRFVNDATFRLDTRRFTELGTTPRRLAYGTAEAARALEEPADLVVALTPSRVAVEAAVRSKAPFATFAVKAYRGGETPDVPPPPGGAKLFHAFAGSENTNSWLPRALAYHRDAYEELAAPFPVARFYFPTPTTAPTIDVLLFGSKHRDLALAMRAFARARVPWAAAIVNEEDRARVTALAREHGVRMQVHGPLAHLALRDLLCRVKLVVNPIVPPSESHYSLAVPLAVGRPIVTTLAEAARPFLVEGGGIVGVPLGDEDAWTAAISTALRDHDGLGARAMTQGRERHDMDRFFVSALARTLGS